MKNYRLAGAIALSLATTLMASSANAAATSKASTMDFAACIATIQRVATQLGVAPINIVETSIMRMVRFPTDDGSVLVTCSKPDRKMIITQSTRR